MSSSGLVPGPFSKRVPNEYWVSLSTPLSLDMVPLPSLRPPFQTADALRFMPVPFSSPWGVQLLQPSASMIAVRLVVDREGSAQREGSPRLPAVFLLRKGEIRIKPRSHGG